MEVQIEDIMLALIRKVVCDREISATVENAIIPEVFPQLYVLSKSHDMAHIVAHGLSELDLLGEDDISQKFQKQKMLALYRYQKMSYELERICHVLENAKIPFIPLKGAVIRQYYLQPWMRTSCDIDVLVHEIHLKSAIDALTDQLHYKNGGQSSHDVSLFSKSGVHVELHYDLIEKIRYPTAVKLLSKVWIYAEPQSGFMYHHRLKEEMFYFYHTVHMAKHFENGGCGVRMVVDQWILDHCVSCNIDNRNSLILEGNLKQFNDLAKALADVWFSNERGNELTKAMSAYIITGGIYGNRENSVAVKRSKEGRFWRYVMSRLFLPYDTLSRQYPILQRKKWLLPFMQVCRWFRLFRKESMKRTVRELKTNRNMSKEKILSTTDLLRNLGLNENANSLDKKC
ncbi:MAG: nucleotidyltransferase family protein [Clostridia bacterium]|nr:nucleotidyltransferase family protein [Clostridia bacterium]